MYAEKANREALQKDPEDETPKRIVQEIEQIKTNLRHAGQPYVRARLLSIITEAHFRHKSLRGMHSLRAY